MKYTFAAAALTIHISAALLAAVPFLHAEGAEATKSGASSDDPGQEDTAIIAEGREIFLNVAQPACGLCHVLAEAGSQGTIAPNLDDIAPDLDQVRDALMSGPGAMPDYSERLSEEQIDAVSRYVAHATASGQDAGPDEGVPVE